MANPTPETEIAWAAGFFDGEGSCLYDAMGCFVISIGQRFRDPLDRFREAVTVGKVYGPYKNNGNGFFQYKTSGRNAVMVLELIRPYLTPFTVTVKVEPIFMGYRDEIKHQVYLDKNRRKNVRVYG